MTYHQPVLLQEVSKGLVGDKVLEDGNYKCIDATLGNAGHTIEIAKRGVSVLAIDIDRRARTLTPLFAISIVCPAFPKVASIHI